MRVFLSHSFRDADFAERLREALHKEGFDAVTPQQSIAPGESIAARVSELIRTSEAVVPIVSASTPSSNWFNMEVALALSRRGRRVIPVLTTSEAHLPPVLKDKRAVMFPDAVVTHQPLRELVTALSSAFPSEPYPGETSAPTLLVAAQQDLHRREFERHVAMQWRWFLFSKYAGIAILLTVMAGMVTIFTIPSTSHAASLIVKTAALIVTALAGYYFGRQASGDSITRIDQSDK